MSTFACVFVYTTAIQYTHDRATNAPATFFSISASAFDILARVHPPTMSNVCFFFFQTQPQIRLLSGLAQISRSARRRAKIYFVTRVWDYSNFSGIIVVRMKYAMVYMYVFFTPLRVRDTARCWSGFRLVFGLVCLNKCSPSSMTRTTELDGRAMITF